MRKSRREGPCVASSSVLVDSTTDHRLVEALAVHRLRFHFLVYRIRKLVVLPEAVFRLSQLDAFLDEFLAIDVPEGDKVLADHLFVRAMGPYHAVKPVDHEVEITVTKLALLAGDLCVSFFLAIRLDVSHAFFH